MNKKIINKSGLVTAMAVSVAALAPQMAAAGERSSSVQSSMERRLEMMEQEIQALRAELAKSRSETRATSAKVDESQQKLEKQLEEQAAHAETHQSLLFFRGGYAAMEHARNNELLLNNNRLNELGSTTTFDEKDGDGWYVGAGFDHHLTDDIWGLWDGAEVDGEVMFEYKNFGTSHNALVESQTIPGSITIENQLTQFTLTASPKIKFKGMGDFKPWIIPAGLAIHVISPPSSGVTVLNPGLMLAAGAEYKIWKDLYLGLDFRYHFTGDDLSYKSKIKNTGTALDGTTILNKTDIDGFTTGAYLGFGF
jgi:opacity protein-like surface antigen